MGEAVVTRNLSSRRAARHGFRNTRSSRGQDETEFSGAKCRSGGTLGVDSLVGNAREPQGFRLFRELHASTGRDDRNLQGSAL